MEQPMLKRRSCTYRELVEIVQQDVMRKYGNVSSKTNRICEKIRRCRRCWIEGTSRAIHLSHPVVVESFFSDIMHFEADVEGSEEDAAGLHALEVQMEQRRKRIEYLRIIKKRWA